MDKITPETIRRAETNSGNNCCDDESSGKSHVQDAILCHPRLNYGDTEKQ